MTLLQIHGRVPGSRFAGGLPDIPALFLYRWRIRYLVYCNSNLDAKILCLLHFNSRVQPEPCNRCVLFSFIAAATTGRSDAFLWHAARRGIGGLPVYRASQ